MQNNRNIPAFLLALGHNSLPKSITVGQKRYDFQTSFKHDFWAASALYVSRTAKVVLKVYRRQDLLGLPMSWVGRWLADREVGFYSSLQDLPQVPRLLGRSQATGFVHEYIAGKTLLEKKGELLRDGFFDELIILLGELHRRGISYTDTNKRDNIIVGDDGKPYLIDFQISWQPKSRLLRPALRYMQKIDIYHVLKHKSRIRPDLMSQQDWQLRRNPGGWLGLHRLIARPFRDFRRATLRRLRRRKLPSNPGTCSLGTKE